MSLQEYQFWYEISPIILVNGVAGVGGMLPIVQLLQPASFSSGLSGRFLGSGSLTDQLGITGPSDGWFAHFKPLPGTGMICNEVGRYTFANQIVAGNAMIVQPLHVSFQMTCPARGDDGFATKFAIMNSLKQTLSQHTALGGLYTLALPFGLYDSCLLRDLKYAGDGAGKQVAVMWQWDFEQVLVTQEQAEQVQSQLMQKISSGTQITPDANGSVNWSGTANTVGQPSSAVTSSVLPTGGSSQGVFGGASSPSSLTGPGGQSAANRMD